MNSLQSAQKALNDFLSKDSNIDLLESAICALAKSSKNGGKIFSCGNGGSMCDAIHFAEELTGRFKDERPPIAAAAISDPGHISCVANDYGYDQVFSRYLDAWANKGDVLVAISTSGNSSNVLKAVESAKQKGMTTIGLLGKDGGKLKSLVDYPIVVENPDTERVQEIHIKCIHIMIEEIEKILF